MPKKIPLRDRFLEKVNIGDINVCWNWKAGIKGSGYGNFWIGNRSYQAHRISFILFKGKIKKGNYICHECDNKLCVNPKHLWQGTHLDNMRDKVSKGRQVRMSGSKNGFAKLTDKDVIEIRELYKTGEFTLKQLGKLYKCHYSNIHLITTNKHWKY